MKVIAFDFDDVLVDSMILKNLYLEMGVTKDAVVDFSMANLPPAFTAEAKRRFSDPSFNTNPVIIDGAVEAVSAVVAMGFRVVIITARPKSVEAVTMDVVARHFPMVSDVLVTGGHKLDALIATRPEALIDDATHNLEAAVEAGVQPILLSNHDTVWNHAARDRYCLVIESVEKSPGAIMEAVGKNIKKGRERPF
jgi:5'(3')-deoxyribonucleotidase